MQSVEKVFYDASNIAVSSPQVLNYRILFDRKDLIKVLEEKDRMIAQLKHKLTQSRPGSDQEFVSKLKKEFPKLTSNDLRICSLLRQNLSTKEVAQNLAIGAESANKARYRIRKKLGLSRKDDLIQFILGY
jgi:DNA-binding CsgD family transcriptional regulator